MSGQYALPCMASMPKSKGPVQIVFGKNIEKMIANGCDGKTVVALAKKELQEDTLYKLFLDVMKEQSVNYDGEFQEANMKPLMFGSDQMYFKKGVGVCALRKSPLGMYVARIHTPFDTICREENLEYISDGAVTFVNKL